jgi:uncharacterized protein YutE (UPF0331/DUF86 family)
MVDINSIIISEKNHTPPKDYYSSFEILAKLSIIPEDFATRLAPCTGLRNRLVHEYDKIQDEVVFDSIRELLKMVIEYIEYVNKYIK